MSLQRLTKKEYCVNRIVVLTVASCMMSLSDLPTVDTIEDSFSATRESLEILEMVPLDSPSDDE